MGFAEHGTKTYSASFEGLIHQQAIILKKSVHANRDKKRRSGLVLASPLFFRMNTDQLAQLSRMQCIWRAVVRNLCVP